MATLGLEDGTLASSLYRLFVCAESPAVRDLAGEPIAGAELDVWQTASNGLYDVQDEGQTPMNLRGIFTTGADGRYEVATVRPVAYPIPGDGPAGELLFANGRHLAAWIGIVPENDSTGGRPRQKGLSKKGDRYLRALLVNGAMALIRQARRRPDRYSWVTKLLARMSAKQAAIAIANKTARIAWAIMTGGGAYEAGHRAPQYRADAGARDA